MISNRTHSFIERQHLSDTREVDTNCTQHTRIYAKKLLWSFLWSWNIVYNSPEKIWNPHSDCLWFRHQIWMNWKDLCEMRINASMRAVYSLFAVCMVHGPNPWNPRFESQWEKPSWTNIGIVCSGQFGA